MRKLPKTIKLGTVIFKVIETPPWKTKGDIDNVRGIGKIDYYKQIIRIANNQPLFIKVEVLWHEISHWITLMWSNFSVPVEDGSFNVRSEIYHNWFADKIMQILADNPALVKLTCAPKK